MNESTPYQERGASAPSAVFATDPPPAGRRPRPRIRIGAALWGLVLAAVGAAVLWVTVSPARRADMLDAILALDAFGWTLVIVVAAGATITLLALASVIRHLQRS